MSDILQDGSRLRQFDERVRQAGHPTEPKACQLELLEWPPIHSFHSRLIGTNAQDLSSRDEVRVRIVFAPLDIPSTGSSPGIQSLYRKFDVPSSFISQRLESVTHSFGATFDGLSWVSWFHFLCKNVTISQLENEAARIADPRGTALSQGDWTWLRTSVFLRWTSCKDVAKACVTLIVFSAPFELIDRCQRLWDQNPESILVDPFSLFAICADEMFLQSQGVLSSLQSVFGGVERTALDLASTSEAKSEGSQADFVGMHNMAKHIIHLKEGADALSLTMGHISNFHKQLVEQPPQGATALPFTRLTHQTLSQIAVSVEVWKLRVASLERRMQNIINLSFNSVAQRDSKVLLRDSKSMKAIATVTVAFLPLATIAAIYGSQFFDYETGGEVDGLVVSHNFWILWLTVAPCSLVVLLLYYYMCYFRSGGVGF